MIAWIGVGFALISSILFSCAAICLRREREKEEAVNMQYLMPGTYRILISGNFFSCTTDVCWRIYANHEFCFQVSK